MGVAESVDAQVRGVTDEEVEAFFEQGWVFLPELISRDVAGRLLGVAERLMGVSGDANTVRPEDGDTSWWRNYSYPRRDDPLFEAVATSSQLGHNLARLFGRDSSIRLLDLDALGVKQPSSKGEHAEPTAFHQDQNAAPFDLLAITVWIALDEVTPDQGSLQFYTGSHKLGPLGDQPGVPRTSPSGKDVPSIALESWPRLMQCELSKPHHHLPGDATMHLSYTVHGAGANTTDRPRWSYITPYFPGDALYTNLPTPYDELGLEPLQPVNHPKFPEIYSPG